MPDIKEQDKLLQSNREEKSSYTNSSDDFDDQSWLDVIKAMEESYVQSLRYQTEIEEKNAELKSTHKFISDVLSSMSDILIVTDENLKIKQVNNSFLKMTGWSEEEIVGQRVDYFISVEDDLLLQDLLLKKNHQDVSVELRGRHSQISLSISCNCSEGSVSNFKGRVLVGRPIGELNCAYNKLQNAYQELAITQEKMHQSEKMVSLGRMVAGVAHELNTPICVLQGNMWSLDQIKDDLLLILETDIPQNSKSVDALEDLPSLVEDSFNASKQIAKIVRELRAFTEHGESSSMCFKLDKAINIAFNWALSTITHEKINIEKHLDNNLQVEGDPSHFQQVMINLIKNATDAVSMVKTPQIIIRSYQKENVFITVEDNGAGIPLDILDKIFDPFFTTKDVGKGTGLGLSISYQLLKDMGADLSAWNKLEGGAVFQIEFQPTKICKEVE